MQDHAVNLLAPIMRPILLFNIALQATIKNKPSLASISQTEVLGGFYNITALYKVSYKHKQLFTAIIWINLH